MVNIERVHAKHAGKKTAIPSTYALHKELRTQTGKKNHCKWPRNRIFKCPFLLTITKQMQSLIRIFC